MNDERSSEREKGPRFGRALAAWMVVTVCASAGCGSKGSTPIGPDPSVGGGSTNTQGGATSGTRLRARFLVGEDGSKQEIGGWHDKQLDIDCAFQAAADGTYRCLPPEHATVSADFFSDAGCTQPMAGVRPGCAPPTYAWALDGDETCGPAPRVTAVFKVGATPAKMFSKDSQNPCHEVIAVAGVALYTIASAVPLTTFVAAKAQVE